jgi:hypothetical protein
VTRKFTPLHGSPGAGTAVGVDRYYYRGDPGSALGLAFQQVSVHSEVGDLPSWYLPASGPSSSGSSSSGPSSSGPSSSGPSGVGRRGGGCGVGHVGGVRPRARQQPATYVSDELPTMNIGRDNEPARATQSNRFTSTPMRAWMSRIATPVKRTRQPTQVTLIIQDPAPVQHRGVQHQCADRVAHRGTIDQLQTHRGAHRPAEQHDIVCAVAQRPAHRRLDVAPLGVPQVTVMVGTGGGVHVIAVAGHQHRQSPGVQKPQRPQRLRGHVQLVGVRSARLSTNAPGRLDSARGRRSSRECGRLPARPGRSPDRAGPEPAPDSVRSAASPREPATCRQASAFQAAAVQGHAVEDRVPLVPRRLDRARRAAGRGGSRRHARRRRGPAGC